MTTMQRIHQAQPNWFSRGNKEFFGDVSYKGYKGKDGKPYLARKTYAWTDMLGQPRRLHVRVNMVDADTYRIGEMVDREFTSYQDAREWIKGKAS